MLISTLKAVGKNLCILFPSKESAYVKPFGWMVRMVAAFTDRGSDSSDLFLQVVQVEEYVILSGLDKPHAPPGLQAADPCRICWHLWRADFLLGQG